MDVPISTGGDTLMEITRYLVDCCVMQNDTTPEAFVGMTRAYHYAVALNDRFMNLGHLRTMNGLIRGGERDPMMKFRTVPAYFDDGSFAPDAENVPRLMEQWYDAYKASIFLTPDFAYFELMRIHPFVDGNGRVGSLLWNHMRFSLMTPKHPPKYETLVKKFSRPNGAEKE